ncbi:hypothetical protein SDC9_112390 [bioreactor metagenome]|uniref:Uncharacterized protein n=1 Tax=bioreactor metagenome TaxID=1076179 RepID=A0A645BQI3_9ZZZZ
MIGYAAHGRFFLIAAVPSRQSQFQFLRRFLGVLKEHLVKISHAEKEKAVRVLVLPVHILLKHGGHLDSNGQFQNFLDSFLLKIKFQTAGRHRRAGGAGDVYDQRPRSR